MDYQPIYKRSLDDPEGFWSEAAAGISWHAVLDFVRSPAPCFTPITTA